MAFSLKRPQSRPSRRALGYAALWGALSALFMVLAMALGRQFGYKVSNPLWWGSCSLFILGLVLAPHHYKRHLAQDEIFNTRRAYLMGVFQSLCVALVFTVLLAGYIQGLDPTYMESFKEQQAIYWQQHPELTDIEKVEKLQWVEALQVRHLLWQTGGEIVMMGVLLSLFIALMFRKQK